MPRTKGIVFLTGASSGLGEGLIRRFVQDGYDVGFVARRNDKLEALHRWVISQGQRAYFSCVDVIDREALSTAIQECESKLGPIDICIANAGISNPTPGTCFDSRLFESIIQTNLIGAANTFSAVIPFMLARKKGHLVGIGSLAGYRALPESAAYCASKAGLRVLMESLRLDLKSHGISASIIQPGFIQSPMTARNHFFMPFLLSSEAGVGHIFNAIKTKKAIVAFPFPMALLAQLLRFTPVWLMDLLLAGYTKNQYSTQE